MNNTSETATDVTESGATGSATQWWRYLITRTSPAPTASASGPRPRPGLACALALAAFVVTFAPAVISAWLLLLSPAARASSASASTQTVISALGMQAAGLVTGVPLLVAARLFALPGGFRLRDLAPGWPSAWVKTSAAFYVPVLAGSLAIYAILDHLGVSQIDETAAGKTLGTGLVASVLAGVGEEVFALALPVIAMRTTRLRPWLIVTIAVALRMSYHVYYGWHAIALLPWALAAAMAFWRWECLLPLVLTHAGYDSLLVVTDHGVVTWPVMQMILILLAVVLVAVSIRLRAQPGHAPRTAEPGRSRSADSRTRPVR